MNPQPAATVTRPPATGRDAGFTLLELLISVIVLSLGVLSVASLQITSTQANFGASQRLEATMLANAVIDRMRANAERLDHYADSTLDGTDAPTGNEPSGCVEGMSEANCLTATATRDLWDLHWEAHQSAMLTAPVVCIRQNAAAPGEMTVVVAWSGMYERVDDDAAPDDACGQAGLGDAELALLQQVALDTYIAPINPY